MIKEKIDSTFYINNHPHGFIPNFGQVNRKAKFYIKGLDTQVFFGREDIRFVFLKKSNLKDGQYREELNNNDEVENGNKENQRGWVIIMKFIQPNPDVMMFGKKKQREKINYFYGNNRSKWKKDINTYEEIVYQNLWKGIDLIFRKEAGELKYEFIVQPHSSPDLIQVEYKGIEELFIDGKGNLNMKTPIGLIMDKAPKTVQRIDDGEKEIKSAYELSPHKKNVVKFNVNENYNPSIPLVIDPSLIYFTYLGGENEDTGSSITIDKEGNV